MANRRQSVHGLFGAVIKKSENQTWPFSAFRIRSARRFSGQWNLRTEALSWIWA
jgi:hypothetical protein